MNWPKERVEILKKLYADGLSASQIASQLGDVTRNAVIGKIHRLNLDGRARPVPKVARPRKPRPPRTNGDARRDLSLKNLGAWHRSDPADVPRPPRPAPVRNIEDMVVPVSLNVSLLDLNDSMCKWPIGDPGVEGFHFCGHKSFGDRPYCEYHCRLAYQPDNDRRRDREAA